MNAVEEIVKYGTEIGACSMLHPGIRSANTLLTMVFKPQGIEFCQKNNFPSLEQLEKLEQENRHINNRNLYINSGTVELCNRRRVSSTRTPKHIVAVGNTEVITRCCLPDETYYIYLFHGARATIYASDYAVVKVETVGNDCSYQFINEDQTAIEL